MNSIVLSDKHAPCGYMGIFHGTGMFKARIVVTFAIIDMDMTISFRQKGLDKNI